MTVLAKYWYLCLNLASDITRNTKTDHLDNIYWLGQVRIDIRGVILVIRHKTFAKAWRELHILANYVSRPLSHWYWIITSGNITCRQDPDSTNASPTHLKWGKTQLRGLICDKLTKLYKNELFWGGRKMRGSVTATVILVLDCHAGWRKLRYVSGECMYSSYTLGIEQHGYREAKIRLQHKKLRKSFAGYVFKGTLSNRRLGDVYKYLTSTHQTL